MKPIAKLLSCLAAFPIIALQAEAEPTLHPSAQDAMTTDTGMTMAGDNAPPQEDISFEPEAIEFFERRIRPVLVERCYGCHSAEAERLKGRLRVDSRDGLLAGGTSGPALEPGDPAASLMLEALRWEDELFTMPPDEKLPNAVIADFERWIAMGAPDPRGTTEAVETAPDPEFDLETALEHWAFQPVSAPGLPEVTFDAWPSDPIDVFILADMEAAGLRPVRDADKHTLLRRITFDLTGLPPTPVDIEGFLKDRRSDAYERVVDRLLASPAFGERWGRHWLDVARYAESSGRETNLLYPHAWRYRDYVIDSFNADKAFDEFLREQLAGDLLPYDSQDERAEQLVATGFLAVGTKSHNTRGRAQFAMDLADEQIDAVTQGMLGLTVACARCHDHKFDPIPSADYYAMAGIFLSTDTRFGTAQGPQNRHASTLIELPAEAEVPLGPGILPAERRALETQRSRLVEQRDEYAADVEKNGRRNNPAAQRLRGVQQRLTIVDQILGRFEVDGSPRTDVRLTMGAREGRPRDARLLVRGELSRAAETVPRGVVSSLATEPINITRGSGRRELAEWIAAPENPLTARVFVNRVWLNLTGRAIVPTPDNFGLSGQPPSHPELLDHLAISFVEDGWSVKRLVKRIVTTHTYRLGSDYDRRSARQDPDALRYWRMVPRRLEAEAIRDAMLAAAGTLSLERPAGSEAAILEGPAQTLERRRGRQRNRRASAPASVQPRSAYLAIVRDALPESLEVFDFAEPAFVTGDRDETTVPLQALYLLNDDEVMRAADAMARRLMRMGDDDVERARLAFLYALGRSPNAREMRAVRHFFSDFPDAQRATYESAPPLRPGRERARNRRAQGGPSPSETLREAGWSAFCQSLFATAEFRTID